MDFTFEKSYDAGVLTLNGELNSSHAENFKSVLMMSLCNSDWVVVNFRNVSELDSMCVQTFCKALRNSRALKKHLIFNGEYLKEKIRGGRIPCYAGCDIFHESACLLMQP